MRKKRNIIIITAAIFFVAAILNLPFLSFVRGFFVKALNPVFSVFYRAGTALDRKFGDRSDKEDMAARLAKLEELNVLLTQENAGLKIARDENVFLRQHLDFLSANNYKRVLANVISKDDIANLSKKSEMIVIDKGSKDGVVSGLPVVSSEGVIVGKVFDVKEGISSVYLTNSDRCKLAATIFGQEKTSGITEGELGLTMKMDFIPQNKKVSVGDVVVTSGLESNIPRGLVVGRVIEVKSDSNDFWQKAVIEPVIDSDDLVIVSVLIP